MLMLVLELIPTGVEATGPASRNDGLRGTRASRAAKVYEAITAVVPVTAVRLEQVPDSTSCGPRVSGKTLIPYNAWILPGDETHRHRVHNNSGGGRGTLVYIVDHKKPEIQCTVKQMAQAVDT